MLTSKNNFHKIAPFYDQNALIQKKMAESLMELVEKNVGCKFDDVLEVGCGTGLFTRLIQKKINYKRLFLNDLHNFISFEGGYDFLEGDIEEINLPYKFDIIFSNATFQWVKDFKRLIQKLHQCLKPQGYLCFTTFGEENLKEVKAVTGVGLNYLTFNEYLDLLGRYFNIITYYQTKESLYFQTPWDVLKHMKLTGVNSVAKVQWTKRNFVTFCELYEQFKTEKGYLLTYHPFYFIVSKNKEVCYD
ncbi:malonyl-ACP O-methyltransferase BioC [Calditerrivibrio nitroreducens]|uniref:malonyl-ACP O-methyltransferase BioC n=1 Tax=Calditerrivibrio nitroreducens TaxID=477976 RepID=UPI003C73EDB5